VTHRYDEFLARLKNGPILISVVVSVQDGEITHCGHNCFEVTRTVMRLEYAGYQSRKRLTVLSPYVREVYSCGHSDEYSVGSFNWQRPRKTTMCYECSKAVPLTDEDDY
jgi:hypothetical protein